MLAAEPGQLNILGESNIPVIAPRASDWTLPQEAKHTRFVVRAQLRYGDLADGGGVKPGRCRTELRIIGHPLIHAEFTERVAKHIFPYSAGHTSKTASEVERSAQAECCYSANLPPSQNSAGEMVVGVSKERNRVDVIHAKRLRLVQRGGAVPSLCILVVDSGGGRTRSAASKYVIQRVRPRIKDLKGEIVTHVMTEIDL